jgi:hypothetical protein
VTTLPLDPALRLVVGADPTLHARLDRLVRETRVVFFAGLPGTGKSLCLHQLAHLAQAAGRVVHLLQWDVARPVFEAAEAGRRYPLADGVTHPLIRRALGLWARRAVAAWNRQHPGPESLLLGETPFVGHRFIELARPLPDTAELLLAAPSCRFVIPVPSREVREFLETERERRAARPLHRQEREDAPPHVLRDIWRQLAAVAQALGLAGASPGPDHTPPYDPDVYRCVYQAVLRHRHAEALPLDTVLPTASLSVYDFGMRRRDLLPTPAEVAEFVTEVERRYPEPGALEREVARWYDV